MEIYAMFWRIPVLGHLRDTGPLSTVQSLRVVLEMTV